MNPSQVPCTICNEGGHHIRNCPSLTEPLKSGFFAPTGGRNYGGDDDDEKAKTSVPPHPILIRRKRKQSHRIYL